MPLDEWAREHLFAPLGIIDATWSKDRAGNVQGMSGLCMSARSLARIGRLVLDGGVHDGHEVVSRGWLDASTRTYRDAGAFWSAAPRGLSWWLGPPRSISANGWGGQYLIAIPTHDLVLVRLRTVEEDERGSFFDDVSALVLGVERPRPSVAMRSLKVLVKLLRPVLRRGR